MEKEKAINTIQTVLNGAVKSGMFPNLDSVKQVNDAWEKIKELLKDKQ